MFFKCWKLKQRLQGSQDISQAPPCHRGGDQVWKKSDNFPNITVIRKTGGKYQISLNPGFFVLFCPHYTNLIPFYCASHCY